MIVKSGRGTGISGTLAYITGEGNLEDGTRITLAPGQESRAEILGGQNLGLELEDFREMGLEAKDYTEFARRQMEFTARPEIQGDKKFYAVKDALHFNLNWAKGEQPTREQQLEAAKDYLKAIGLEKAQAVIVAHHDRKEDKKGNPRAIHVHGVAQMVDRETGMAYDDRNRGFRERHWGVDYEERMLKEQNWPIPQASQWRHDQRAVTRGQPDYEKLLDILGKNESAITKFRVENALAFGGHVEPQHMAANRENFVQHNNLQRLADYPNGADAAYATQETIAQERRIMGMAKKLHAQIGFEVPDHILDEVCKKHNADDEQKASARHLTRDNGFAVQTGNGGTGKSHVTNKIVRDCYEAMGRDVAGGGFTNNVALQMKQDGMLRANTLDYWKTRLGFEKPDAPEPILKRGSVFVFEEGGQVKNDHFESIYNHLHARGVKAILSGDPKQMASIEKGAMMDVHTRQFGTSVLTKVYRNPEKQQLWDEMAEGTKAKSQSKAEEKWKKAIEGFRDRGEIHWFDTTEETIEGIAKQHAQDHKDYPDQSQLMLGTTNDEVRQLNDAVIALQKENGARGAEILIETSRGLRAYAVGDRITLKDNHPDVKEKRKGFANGALGNLIGLQPDADGRHRMTVDLDRPKGAQRRVFSFFPGLNKEAGEIDTDHGWAGTNYKGQGKTIDFVYPLHNPIANRNTNYVAMTRDKAKVFLGVARETTGGYRGLVEQMSHGKSKRAAHSYFMKDEQSTQPERPIQKQEECVATERPRVRILGNEFVPPREMPAAQAVGGMYQDHRDKLETMNEKFKHYLWDRPHQRESIAQWREHTREPDTKVRGRDVYRDWIPDVRSLFTRRDIEKNIEDAGGKPRLYRCHDCNESMIDKKEEYMVKDKVWAQSGMGPDGYLCLDDLEKRIGRKLNHDDFPRGPNMLNNTDPNQERSEMFKDRLNRKPDQPKAAEAKRQRADVAQSAYGKMLKEGEAKGWPRGVSQWADMPPEPKKREEKLEQPKRGWSVNDIPGNRIVRGAARKIESAVDNLEEKIREKWNRHVADPVRNKVTPVANPVRNISHSDRQKTLDEAEKARHIVAPPKPQESAPNRIRRVGSAMDGVARSVVYKAESLLDNADEKIKKSIKDKVREKTIDPIQGKLDSLRRGRREVEAFGHKVKRMFEPSERQQQRDEKKAAPQGPETGNGRTRDMTAATSKPQTKTVRDDVDRAFRLEQSAQSKRDKIPTVAPGQSADKGQESRPAPAKHNLQRDQGHSGGSGLGM